ncbi:hypothetical protein CCACVL1_14138 [Corchorus capsularis]|uniref:RNA polymerase II C-terminal domain phosphatase-like n=1 Tax=Corchorus capsularis TaxID=210143 RepID=A0A1R3I828_COCAP|nr:hypothetical protein CCACVL1_14138 [Corchorus capsularis]
MGVVASDLSIKEERGVPELLHQLQQYPHGLETSKSSPSTCRHPAVVVNGVCYHCRQKIENKDTYGLEFSYLYMGLKLSHSEMDRLRCLGSKKQLSQKKLHLVLDIDGTLLHSFPPGEASKLGLSKNDKNTKEIDGWVVKLRPMVLEFLEKASAMFEMYLYTLGSRSYAKMIAKILDPQGVYFNNRIISRDDNPYGVYFKTLDLILGEESNILILDDNPEVWAKHLRNLILMKPFVFTGTETSDEITERNTPILGEILKLLHTIHSLFFQQEVGCRDVRDLASEVRSNVLRGCNLYMKQVKDSKLWDVAKALGGTCCSELNSSVTHLVSCKRGTKDYNWGVKKKKFLVHKRCIEEANYLWQRLPEENYRPTMTCCCW